MVLLFTYAEKIQLRTEAMGVPDLLYCLHELQNAVLLRC